ncbi:MAG: hypothetical protein Q8920_16680 [Bacillota bacterium]|nr:hypothetical protein [Bacillota bacterium]
MGFFNRLFRSRPVNDSSLSGVGIFLIEKALAIPRQDEEFTSNDFHQHTRKKYHS